ncbi:MAG: aminotransferase class V-fold PLP-dependent enzyme [Pirellula sp.]
MLKRSRVYLDNAATSWPRPAVVSNVVDDYQRRLGVSVGRGTYAEANIVGEIVEETRMAVARLIGAESPDRIIFTLNGTDSLNLAIHGILKAGDHVVTTVVEHNSVLRPLRRLEKLHSIEVSRVGCDEFGIVSPKGIRAAIRPNTKLIVITHASNVTGAIQQVEAIGLIAREHGILFLVDAAQTLGHIPVSVSEMGADLLAAPGHKGLLGPLGTGILYIRRGVEELLDSVRQGGTGSASSSEDQPETLPEKYESGSLNAPGIIGLGAGIGYVEQRGLVDIRQHAIQLTDQLMAGLSNIPGVTVYGPRSSEDRIGVVSVTFADQAAPSVAKRLEEEFRIQVRGGFQCAALLHRSLGTIEQQGTVRFSGGPFKTPEDLEAASEAARNIAGTPGTVAEPVTCPCVAAVREQNLARPDSSFVLPAAAEVGSVATLSRTATDVAEIPGLRELWGETLGDPRVCIAVLDGPVDLSHPCFQGADIAVHPSSIAGPNKGAATQHGTHVASVIFGQHHSDVKGIAPNCHGVIIPVFRDGQNGEVVPCSQIDLARAITLAVQYAKECGAVALLINISGGQSSPSGEAHPLLGDVVKNLSPEMYLIVSATGNQGCDCLHIPGAMPTVLAVGAMSRDGDPLPFSNWGKSYRTQGILAIGEDIQGGTVDHKVELRTGTSYATPIVTGIAALLLSGQLKHTGNASAERVRQAILHLAVDCEQEPITDCRRLLAGRLNVPSALLTLIHQGYHNMTDSRQPDFAAAEEVASQNQIPHPSTTQKPAETGQQTQDARIRGSGSRTPEWSVTKPPINANMVLPAGCGCGGSKDAPLEKVYAIGKLSFDYGTRQRREYFRNAIGGDPDNPANLYMHLTGRPLLFDSNGELVKDPETGRLEVAFNDQHQPRLDKSGHPFYYSMPHSPILNGPQFANRSDVSSLTWVLMINETPVYAISPAGAFAFDIHNTLVGFVRDQLHSAEWFKSELNWEQISDPGAPHGDDVERIALAGVVVGETQLYSGERVPIVVPDHRGLASWTTAALLSFFQKTNPAADEARIQVETILNRLYYMTRNFGLESRDRALNYAATDALQIQRILGSPLARGRLEGKELDTIDVRPSPICRPGYDCWDVVMSFYNPGPGGLTEARQAIRYTIDVSDVLPYIVANSTTVFSLR